MESEVLLKWKKSGLLFSLKDGSELAQLFENMTLYVESKAKNDFDDLLLPIVARIFRNEKFKGQIDVQEIYALAFDAWHEYSEVTRRYFPLVDVELNFVFLVMEQYINSKKK